MLPLFLASVAQGATGVDSATPTTPTPTPTTTTGTTGTQSASRCSEPRMAKFPKRALKLDKLFYVKATGLAPGTQWLMKIDGHDWAAGTADTTGIIKEQEKMVDFGLGARKVPVDLVLANETCENSPWKLTRKVGWAGRFPDGQPPAAQTPAQTPAATAPAATPAPVVPKPVIPKPVKPVKIKPLEVPRDGRAWITPTDITSHSTDAPKQPELPRAELVIDKAQSTNALVGLGGLFILIAIATATALIVLNRKDSAADSAIEEGRLPSHLDEAGIGNLALSEAGIEVVKKGAPPRSLLQNEANTPVLEEGEDPLTEDLPAEVPATAEHVASEPGDVPMPIATAGEKEFHAPTPPEIDPQGVGADNVIPFLEEQQPSAAEVPPAAEPRPEPVNAAANGVAVNGHGANGAGEPEGGVDALVQSMIDDAGVQQELRSIVAEARNDALRQGVPVNQDGIIAELQRVTSSEDLPDAARAKLMSRFQQIVSEELDQVPQTH